ncbi:hypothetical protein CEXT_199341 [Caerostris extrusa]|uniref:Uncharacterized protein n=1 Tax=Caerostris extrusa TaxID=172846 RepID=A0AAV4WU81_CAEEX|nr:hypothetical protein CEXT_199341 [Caerostris extrusa]
MRGGIKWQLCGMGQRRLMTRPPLMSHAFVAHQKRQNTVWAEGLCKNLAESWELQEWPAPFKIRAQIAFKMIVLRAIISQRVRNPGSFPERHFITSPVRWHSIRPPKISYPNRALHYRAPPTLRSILRKGCS